MNSARAFTAIIGAVLIWAAWLPATKMARLDGVAPFDLSLLRYGVPALMLAPFWRAAIRKLPNAPLWTLVAMLGWGAPFVYLVSTAFSDVNTVHAAAIVPCTMPLFALAFERVAFGTRVLRSQIVGFALIACGAALILAGALSAGGGAAANSILLLMFASLGWASFTVAFRRSGLNGPEATAYICAVSTLSLIAVELVAPRSVILSHSLGTIGFHALSQGVFSGFLATILYARAIDGLGSARASSFSVLVPVLATLIGYLWLNERPGGFELLALCAATIGVALVNGVFRRNPG